MVVLVWGTFMALGVGVLAGMVERAIDDIETRGPLQNRCHDTMLTYVFRTNNESVVYRPCTTD
jgi:hypothetical protein